MVNYETTGSAPVAVAATSDEKSYVDWPAIFAGTVLASAISFVLLTFGSAIGLSLTSAYEGEGISFVAFAIAAGLWLLWVQISSFFAGGYLTGRLRRRKFDSTEQESDLRDGSHGLVVWALGVLIISLMTLSGLGAAATTAANAVSTVAAGAATGAGAAATDAATDANGPVSGLMVDRFLRGQVGPEGAGDDTRGQVTRVLASALTEDTLDPADREYLAGVVASRTGLAPEQAAARVDELWAQAQQAEQTARDAAERARRIGMIVAFLTAASLVVSAAAAYFAAVLGGNHRDKEVFFADWSRPW